MRRSLKLKNFCHEVIFGTTTLPGKAFDILLLIFIVLSIVSVMLGSDQNVKTFFEDQLYRLDWLFTILFTLEYALRVWCSKDRKEYIFSFLGKVDFIAIMPTYLSIFFPSAHFFMIVRSLRILRSIRLMRVFHIFNLQKYLKELKILKDAFLSSKEKIIVFLGGVLTLVLICGSLMYFIEHDNPGFSNIFQSTYWAIVTMTTVGYGDIAPVTTFGKILASIMMVMSYGIIAVPTGLVSAEFVKRSVKKEKECYKCGTFLPLESKFCLKCGIGIEN